MSAPPILYSFRRCPYAMRARMALLVSETPVRLREVVLREKPDEMIAASPKATVPVLVLGEGTVIDESLDIMLWALERNDPQDWLITKEHAAPLIAEADGDFKDHLDRYKYPNRYEGVDPYARRAAGLEFLQRLEEKIAATGQISGCNPGLADYAIFPFIRQFANVDRHWFDTQPLPALQKWLHDHLQSILFQSIMIKYPQWVAGDEEPLFAHSNCT